MAKVDQIPSPVPGPRSSASGPRSSQREPDRIWALKNVSFNVEQGEVLGIIGRNGAGKSTLLKILSRVTAPTIGRIKVRGRVASLLEVGTGFHPELTGRENVYLNGSILGMTRREITRKFDEIVDFAGVEKFIDTPVKRYSSGMHVRLAFAVAAHLDPEILLVDEVLAVGDADFQKKCLGKMGDVARGGRTILFVSHNMSAIIDLCEKVLVFNQGENIYTGKVRTGVQKYLKSFNTSHSGEINLVGHPSRQRGSKTIIRKIRFLDNQGTPKLRFLSGESMDIELSIETENTPKTLVNPRFWIGIDDWLGFRLFSLTTDLAGYTYQSISTPCKLVCKIKHLPLVSGRYTISLSVSLPHKRHIDALYNASFFEIEPSDYFKSGRIPKFYQGRIFIPHKWKIAK